MWLWSDIDSKRDFLEEVKGVFREGFWCIMSVGSELVQKGHILFLGIDLAGVLERNSLAVRVMIESSFAHFKLKSVKPVRSKLIGELGSITLIPSKSTST